MSATSFSDATEFIVRQQFHRDNDVIVDRTGERNITVPGADRIIESIIRKINSETVLWETGREEQFLERMSALLGLRAEKVIQEANQKLDALADAGTGPMVDYMTAMGVVFSMFREMVNKNLIKQIIQEYPAAIPFQDELESNLVLAESLLANLAFLHQLATITGISINPSFLQAETEAAVKRTEKK